MKFGTGDGVVYNDDDVFQVVDGDEVFFVDVAALECGEGASEDLGRPW